MANFWEIKQADRPKTIDIYIYSNIQGDSYDWWTGEKIESETSANSFLKKLESFGELDNVNIYINSLGGSCFEGHAIYNILKRCKAYKTVYVDGFACSVASVIAMAGDKIVMPKNTVMMIHNAWTYACGNAKQLRKEADNLDTMNSAFMNAYLNKVGDKLTKEKLTQMLDEETTLSAEQCIEYGLADKYAEYDVDMVAAQEAIQKAKEKGSKQLATSLDKVAALVTKVPEQSEPQPEENPAFHVFEKCINALCSQLQK